jgi:polyisoprenoid-binding protein YceI
LVGHLKSEDFFHAEAHPTASFAITGVRAEANEEKGTTHVISGNLTMRGVEKNISFPATVTITDAGVTIDAPEFAIDRKNWNVMFGSTGIVGLAKEKLIDDSILLTLNVQAKY